MGTKINLSGCIGLVDDFMDIFFVSSPLRGAGDILFDLTIKNSFAHICITLVHDYIDYFCALAVLFEISGVGS